MTDLEILKELEEEVGYEFWEKENYTISPDGFITEIIFDDDVLIKIPLNLLRLKSLVRVHFWDNTITDLSPLLELTQLKHLSLSYHINFFPNLNLYLSFKKYIKHTLVNDIEIAIYNSKEIMIYNHLFSFFLKEKKFKKKFQKSYHGYRASNVITFPLLPMFSLGYNNMSIYIDYFFKNIRPLVNRRVEDKIASKLLEIFYKDYQKNEFPCAIRKIRICDYHGIDNLLIDNIAVDTIQKTINDPHWIFLTGENGYGKTSILQAIVLALYGKEDKEGVILDKKKKANIFLELKENINPEFKERHGLRINHAGEKTDYGLGWIIASMFTKFAAYGASRLNVSNDERNQTYSLFNSDGTLLNIENDLEKWYDKKNNDDLYQNTRLILLELLSPYIDNLKIKEKDGDYTVFYHETQTPSKNWKVFNELASGYKNIIATFGDMILRLRREQPKVRNAKDLVGIVIIDEFDLHLHPKWQKELVEKLTKTFPKIQFIVSTHSPIPLLGAPKNSIIINVQRSEEEGITARKLDIDFTKLTPNSILSSPIFGFDDIFSNQTTAEDVETADSYEDVKNDERLRKKLNILKGTDEDFFNDLKGE